MAEVMVSHVRGRWSPGHGYGTRSICNSCRPRPGVFLGGVFLAGVFLACSGQQRAAATAPSEEPLGRETVRKAAARRLRTGLRAGGAFLAASFNTLLPYHATTLLTLNSR